MHLDFTDDQRAILDALDSLAKPFESAPIHDAPLAATSAELNSAIVEGGFLDVAQDPDLGTTTAAIVIERLARLPFAVEAGASAMFRPLLSDPSSQPVCLVDERHLARPVRFLGEGATIIVVGDSVRKFGAEAGVVHSEPEALFAYPMAMLSGVPDDAEKLNIPVGEAKVRWQVAIAAEIAGLLAAALKSTCEHTTDRNQFGRPLATFQALRHRLAEAQVRTNGVYWLAMKAASTLDPADAAMAALHAQESAKNCVYDFHQFLGAMGMTLEHPLHLWTYRLKALIGELGGRGAQAQCVADKLWPAR
ncbi:acyl-CoA dehydrogenase family protein [Pontixanthobacter aquaemixtae]|uniref:Acyl-CoA dehydrogenase n=1 Tax=Pontixanthobacter aquaemixtae TaxID=1958940 RepID=A0A844ZRH8_9SPHN|nr:acyl-CoA dehydrogenase family protein [Pontixanthobacter aquaemixtae]MXO89922.1 acyl-CoA dehydrogenase [Pontixanthobacter aquaemixtae]